MPADKPDNAPAETHIGFRLPRPLWTRFKAVAKARMLSASALLRLTILREVEEHERIDAERDGRGGAL